MEVDILSTLGFWVNHHTLYEDASIKLRWALKRAKDEKEMLVPKHTEDELFDLLSYLSYISTTQLDLIKHQA